MLRTRDIKLLNLKTIPRSSTVEEDTGNHGAWVVRVNYGILLAVEVAIPLLAERRTNGKKIDFSHYPYHNWCYGIVRDYMKSIIFRSH